MTFVFAACLCLVESGEPQQLRPSLRELSHREIAAGEVEEIPHGSPKGVWVPHRNFRGELGSGGCEGRKLQTPPQLHMPESEKTPCMNHAVLILRNVSHRLPCRLLPEQRSPFAVLAAQL